MSDEALRFRKSDARVLRAIALRHRGPVREGLLQAAGCAAKRIPLRVPGRAAEVAERFGEPGARKPEVIEWPTSS